MDMLRSAQIAGADLTDWREPAQGLHARYLVDGFGAAARFVAAVGEAGDALGHHPHVSIGRGHVDLGGAGHRRRRLPRGRRHRARRRVGDAAGRRPRATDHRGRRRPRLAADPASVSEVKLGLDTAHSATIAPVWAALLTGSAESQGRGSPSDRGPGRHGPGA